MSRMFQKSLMVLAALFSAAAQQPARKSYDYRVLATSRTSTMEKELNQAAQSGFRFSAVMGGESAFGGKEVILVVTRDPANPAKGGFEYKLLATSRTSTMQKELQEAADLGFEYRGQTVFQSAFGGKEVAVIMERDRQAPVRRYEYKLLATSRTSTMQKELAEAGENGYDLAGMSVGKTAMGGSEVVCILRKALAR